MMDIPSIRDGAEQIISAILDDRQRRSVDPIVDIVDFEGGERLRTLARPGASRPLADVIDDACNLFQHRVRMDHPLFFGFIPSPASPLSWLGDMLTTGFNPHAGSWMQSSGPSAIEDGLIAWLAEQVGLPASAGGLFVTGGSMANLTGLVLARDQMLRAEDRPRGVAYVSDQTHSSVAKGLAIIGFPADQIRKVKTDADFRMDVGGLSEAITADRANGLLPFAVIASCGTTNTGSIDPLDAIADLTAAEGIWLHIDGAYGASVALSSSYKSLVAGLARADSLSWDAHKWLFQTYGCGIVLVRDKQHLTSSFSTRPEYLRDAVASDETPNFWDFGPELTRPARAIKLWLTLQVLGVDGLGAMIDHGFGLAEAVEREMRARPHWQILSPANLAIVNFRFCPPGLDEQQLDQINDDIARTMVADNVAGLLTTRLGGKTVLRVCAISPDATVENMAEVAEAVHQRALAFWRAMGGDATA